MTTDCPWNRGCQAALRPAATRAIQGRYLRVSGRGIYEAVEAEIASALVDFCPFGLRARENDLIRSAWKRFVVVSKRGAGFSAIASHTPRFYSPCGPSRLFRSW